MSSVTFSAVHNDDGVWMRQALALAEKGLFTTTPNPRVGAVVVKDGQKVGEGYHQVAGDAHAEVFALKQAGALARGATLYVTLEPCSHFGRTPPCVESVIEAGVRRVVIAMTDPNPLVAGQGIARLQQQGIEVTLGVEEHSARQLNLGFISRMERQRPWIRAKVAMSLDGVTALENGESQWITHEGARQDGHYWRARSCAMLTGAGTVRHDNPRLTVRALKTQRQPLRLVIDNRLDTSPESFVYDEGNAVIMTVNSSVERARLYEKRGVKVRVVDSDANGRVSMRAVLELLQELSLNEVMIETGHKLTGVLLEAGLIDEWLCYMAPTLLGVGGSAIAQFGPLSSLQQRHDLLFHEITRIGEDVRLILRTPMANQWLNKE